jgi:hypothetical protein
VPGVMVPGAADLVGSDPGRPRMMREIQVQGVAYSLSNVQRFVNQLRRAGPPPDGCPCTPLTPLQGPSPRHVAALILRRPERRTDEQRAYLKLLTGEEPVIATAITLAKDFLVMLRRREAGDQMAVQAGLTLRWSNGQTEGQITKLKLIKRQGYGRAKFDLLRTQFAGEPACPGEVWVYRAPGSCHRLLDDVLGRAHHRRTARPGGVAALPVGPSPPPRCALA